MGRALTATIAARDDAEIAALFDRPELAGQSLGERVLVAPEAAAAASDVLIDFTTPAASVALARACAARGGPALVIGSTGLTEADAAAIDAAAERIAVVRSGNFSLGVNMLIGLVEQAARALQAADWDIEVFEAHHRRKVDAPSGTALMLGEAAARGRGVSLADVAERGRDGVTGPRAPGAIGFSVMRAGGIVGEHSVVFAAEDEILTLSHSARNRSLFARGAVEAAIWASGRPPGLYDMMDVLGFAQRRGDRELTCCPSTPPPSSWRLRPSGSARWSCWKRLARPVHEAVNPALNAVVARRPGARASRARAIDDRRVAGEHLGALAGLPMTIKDTLDVDGLPASSGLKALLGRTPRDSAVAARARAAGAVIWGKTNVPVMAGDWQSFNGLYGVTNNPWDVKRTSGGSSGGAAAALASGITALEIGSDIGGSLRVPAAFCGVFSHKPTWGMVSQRGHVPPRPGTLAERDLNVVGPMARSARDLRLLLSVLEEGAPLAAKAPPAELKDLRVGLWTDEPGFPLDPEVRAVVEAFGERLAVRGAAVERVRPVDGPALLAAYRQLLAPLIAEDMPPALRRRMERARPFARLAHAVGVRRAWAVQVLNNTASHADWLAANEARARFGQHLRGVFERHDVLIAPVACVTAFPHDHAPFSNRRLALSDGRAIDYGAMLNWISMATACGLPATAFPAGPSASGLPVGVQIIGPRGGDARVLSVAQAIEEALGGFVPPPEMLLNDILNISVRRRLLRDRRLTLTSGWPPPPRSPLPPVLPHDFAEASLGTGLLRNDAATAPGASCDKDDGFGFQSIWRLTGA